MGSLSKEVPGELREFARLFEGLSSRHSDYGRVYGDFIDYFFGGLLVRGDAKIADELKGRYGEDYGFFGKMVAEMLFAYNKKIVDDGDWYDGLGVLYEAVKSNYKASRLGQFFTPPGVCDLMVLMVIGEVGERVMDNCCGSGRMLIAAKAANPRLRFYGADVDPVCSKMAAINMAMHGCVGEVSCMNSLSMEWYWGVKVNEFMGPMCVMPHLDFIKKEDSVFMVVKKAEVDEVKVGVGGQLSLF